MTWGMPLWLLGVPVSLILLCWGLVRHWRRSSVGGWSGMKAVSLDGGRLREMVNGLRPPGRLIFFWLAMCFLSVALARPQLGWIELPRFERSREVMVALDLSKSMWADDVKPSRLDRSRLLVDNLLDHLKGERVGLVLFAGSAFTQSPLSADYEVLREFLPELSPEYLPQGGTNYAAMLDAVLESFSQGPDSAADRYLIILSDGESLSDEWQSRMKGLKDAGVKVIGLGIGTPQGAVIQEPGGGVIKDSNGSAVLSRLNAATLQALARGTGGEYRQADRWLDLPELLQQTVEKGRKGDFSEKKDRKPMERYQVPLLLALILFALSWWREYPVRPRVAPAASVKSSSMPVLDKGRAVPPPLPTTVGLWLMMMGVALSQATATPPGAETGDTRQLAALVIQMSQKKVLDVTDYAALAQETVMTGKRMMAAGNSLPRGAVEDGLESVFAGETLNAEAAEWETLRKELEELLKQTPEQKQEDQKDQQEQEDQKKQDQNQDNQQQNQDQQNQNSKQDESGQEGQQGQKNQDQQDQQDSQTKPGENSDQQGESGKERDQQNQDQKPDAESSNSDPSESNDSQDTPGQQEERNEENQLGPMDSEPQSEEASPPPQSPKPEAGKPQKLQTIQGSSNEGAKSQSKDPTVVAAMKELEEVKGRDMPAELFQRMQGSQRAPDKKGKDW